MAALHHRLRPRLGGLRLRGGSVLLGIIPAWTMPVRLALAATPPSRLTAAPLRAHPTSLATCCKAFRPWGHKTMAVSLPGATGRGAHTEPLVAVMALPCAPCSCWGPAEPSPAPRFWRRCGSRRHGVRWGRGADLSRDAGHWPQTPARGTHHPPVSRRLGQRSWNAEPVCRWSLAEWVNTATASLLRALMSARRRER